MLTNAAMGLIVVSRCVTTLTVLISVCVTLDMHSTMIAIRVEVSIGAPC